MNVKYTYIYLCGFAFVFMLFFILSSSHLKSFCSTLFSQNYPEDSFGESYVDSF